MGTLLDPRERILHLVKRYPGLHVRDLARRSAISEALAAYHLTQLATEGHLELVEDGVYRRYYIRGTAVGPQDKEWMSVLRRPAALQIALFVLENGSASHSQLTDELQLAKSTVSYHLTNLMMANFIRRNAPGEGFVLVDPARVAKLLARWAPTPDLTDKFSDLWGRFYRTRTKKRS